MRKCKHFMRIEDELIQHISIMGLAINRAHKKYTHENIMPYLEAGKEASEKINDILTQMRKEACKCGDQ